MDHITVCICTYKRAEILQGLLEKLKQQITQKQFEYSVVVVDNDQLGTAEQVVNTFSNSFERVIDYYIEPVQNISLARNKAVDNAKGNYIAFIDDDEFPTDSWLLTLYNACNVHKADGVLGPVKPHFNTEPPRWIAKGKICERKTFTTGTLLKNSSDTRTGNVLLKKSLLNKGSRFNPDYGRTGGEDVEFFHRKIKEGKRFIWCNEAPVYEHVPAERMTRKYHLRRALLRGKVAASRNLSIANKVQSLLKSIAATIVYTVSLCVMLFIGHHIFMKYLIRLCDHVGKILASMGFEVLKER